jgi:hypothetical protein
MYFCLGGGVIYIKRKYRQPESRPMYWCSENFRAFRDVPLREFKGRSSAHNE